VKRAAICLVVVLYVVVALLVAACGSDAVPSTSPSPEQTSPGALPAPAPPPSGGTEPAPAATSGTTGRSPRWVAEAWLSAWRPDGIDEFMGLYAQAAQAVDNGHAGGPVAMTTREAIAAHYAELFALPGAVATKIAVFASGPTAAVEMTSVSSAGTAVPRLTVLTVDNGLIVNESAYYYDSTSERQAPTPVRTRPTTSDTATATRRIARLYQAGMQDRDAARLASLYGAGVVYQDTAFRTRWNRSGQVVQQHQTMFELSSVSFTPRTVVGGKGWAVVTWVRTDVAPATGIKHVVPGATLLEIRNRKIVRETLYFSHTQTGL
jgi:hypothetical protein